MMKSTISCPLFIAVSVSFAFLTSVAEAQLREGTLLEDQDRVVEAELAKAQEDIVEAQAEVVKAQREVAKVQAALKKSAATAGRPPAARSGTFRNPTAGMAYTRQTGSFNPRQTRPSQKINNAMNKLKAADSEKAKADAKAELTELLVAYFDVDMNNREKEVAKIEQRVQKLRTQISKRQAAKDSIIKLQMQVLENEAEGLGFFGNSNPSATRRSGRSSGVRIRYGNGPETRLGSAPAQSRIEPETGNQLFSPRNKVTLSNLPLLPRESPIPPQPLQDVQPR